MSKEIYTNQEQIEKAILVTVGAKNSDRERAFENLAELESLADTAGAEVIEKIYQELPKPNSKTMIGKGKVEELKLIVLEHDIQLIVFDDDLTPAQVKNLEKGMNVKVIDRSGLILDIFAKHAQSIEAQTQVELAQLEYLMPRLTRMWTHLSKQYGGIGTKGPGETQIETDRRIVRYRIQKLKQKLKTIDTQREQQRKKRNQYPQFALVGYTNAGKSTLMNTLTASDVYVEDKLFATLDTTVRKFQMPNGKPALLSDTVGFIRKLPHHLIASFRSTLAEAGEADILLHIVDISHKFFREHINVVNKTLEYLKIANKTIVLIFNKIDALPENESIGAIGEEYPNSIFISAKRNININKLLELMQEKFEEQINKYEFTIPYSNMELVSGLYAITDIISRDDKDNGILFEVHVTEDNLEKFLYQFGKFIKL